MLPLPICVYQTVVYQLFYLHENFHHTAATSFICTADLDQSVLGSLACLETTEVDQASRAQGVKTGQAEGPRKASQGLKRGCGNAGETLDQCQREVDLTLHVSWGRVADV